MGLLRWIKRELEVTNSSKRRQSEPTQRVINPSMLRDEAYIRALAEFNQRRIKQKIPSINHNNNNNSNNSNEQEWNSINRFEGRCGKRTQSEPFPVTQRSRSSSLVLQCNTTTTVKITPDKPPRQSQLPIKEDNEIKFEENSNSNSKNETNIYEEIRSYQSPKFNVRDFKPHLTDPPKEFYRRNSNPFAKLKSPVPKPCQPLTDYDTSHEASRSILKEKGQQTGKSTKHVRICQTSKRKCNKATNTSYQTIVNKHGDLVEYAVPLVDQESFSDNSKVSKNLDESEYEVSKYEDTIDRNFCFLDEKKFEGNTIVTDLDNSDGTKQIFEELATLENWSANIRNTALNNSHIVLPVCSPEEVRDCGPVSPIRDNFRGPLEWVTKKFRKSTTTVRRVSKDDDDIAREALTRDYRVLSEMRHSDIALLMAICVENDRKIQSLLIEPVQCTLNYLIHNVEERIPLLNCINYALQISRAVTYLHESGYIHSNIMSHNILVCEYKNSVKLSSFELSVDSNLNAKEEILSKHYNCIEKNYINGQFLLKNMNATTSNKDRVKEILKDKNFPNIYLPYNVFYRQIFSKYFYQPPELLTTTSNFVFPTKLSDIYGISLLIWEMISGEVPYAKYSYTDLEKKKGTLPIPANETLKFFEAIFKYGLSMEPDKRIQSIDSFIEILESIQGRYVAHIKKEELSKSVEDQKQSSLSLEDTNISTFATPLKPQKYGSVIYERTSTLKKSKTRVIQNVANVFENAPLLTIKPISKSLDSIFEKCFLDAPVNTPTQNKSYKFEIGEFSLPNTPIARRNKLLKNAWLADVPISVNMYGKINSPEEKTTTAFILNDKTPTGNTSRLRINIKIVHKSSSSSPKATPIASSKSSQTEVQAELPETPKTSRKFKGRKTIPSDNTSIRTNLFTEIESESISELFPKKNDAERSHEFENVLWKREKDKCESVCQKEDACNGEVVTPKRASVKEFINKFECLTKSENGNLSSPIMDRKNRSKFSKSNDSGFKALNFSKTPDSGIHSLNSRINDEESSHISKVELILNANSDSSNRRASVEKKAVESDTGELRGGSPKMDVQIGEQRGGPSKVEVQVEKVGVSPKMDMQVREQEDILSPEEKAVEIQVRELRDVPSKEVFTDSSPDAAQYSLFEKKAEEMQMAELKDVVLRSGPEMPIAGTSTDSNLEKMQKALLALNVTKLNRRASEILNVSRRKPQANQGLAARHSLCGSDLTKKFGKIIYINSDKIEKLLVGRKVIKTDDSPQSKEPNSAKLSCWNCGSCVFLVGKTSDIERNLIAKVVSNSKSGVDMSLPKNARKIIGTRSIEDLYIDDDFCQGLVLGANMELGSGSELPDLLDLLGEMDCVPLELLY